MSSGAAGESASAFVFRERGTSVGYWDPSRASAVLAALVCIELGLCCALQLWRAPVGSRFLTMLFASYWCGLCLAYAFQAPAASGANRDESASLWRVSSLCWTLAHLGFALSLAWIPSALRPRYRTYSYMASTSAVLYTMAQAGVLVGALPRLGTRAGFCVPLLLLAACCWFSIWRVLRQERSLLLSCAGALALSVNFIVEAAANYGNARANEHTIALALSLALYPCMLVGMLRLPHLLLFVWA